MPPLWRYSGPLGDTSAILTPRPDMIRDIINLPVQPIGFDTGSLKRNSVPAALIILMRCATFSMPDSARRKASFAPRQAPANTPRRRRADGVGGSGASRLL